MIEPYYDRNGITIYCGDCREIAPHLHGAEILDIDGIVTDPPYPDFNNDHGKGWECPDLSSIAESVLPDVRQFIFWPALTPFPLDYTAVHIWHKPNGQSNEHYERIFERYGQKTCRVWRIPIINYRTLPKWTPHPTQKPLRLVKELVNRAAQVKVFDPFMGSGTTLVAAKQLGRKAIGIEINPDYCELAVKRLQQDVLPLEME